MHSVSHSHRVYVLGAGASVFAGYPLAAYLLPFIRDLQTVDMMTKQIASAILEKLAQAEFLFNRNIIRDPNRTPNLEELLTYLELYHSFPGTIFNANPWSLSDSGAVRRLVTEKFLAYQYDLHKVAWERGRGVGNVTVEPDQFENVTTAWAGLVKPGDIILTFNWDILHEVILWRHGLWSYKDGYGFQCGTQGEKDGPSKVQLLKLHGSVNWVQENDSEPVSEIASVGDFFTHSKDWEWRNHTGQAQTDSGRKLVLPTYLKDISSNRALLSIWSEAHKAIVGARELTVIGYSLHRVDHPARLMLGTALSQNTDLKKVTVISPDTAEWDTFLGQLGKEMVRIPRKFEDWVCSAPKSGSR